MYFTKYVFWCICILYNTKEQLIEFQHKINNRLREKSGQTHTFKTQMKLSKSLELFSIGWDAHYIYNRLTNTIVFY